MCQAAFVLHTFSLLIGDYTISNSIRRYVCNEVESLNMYLVFRLKYSYTEKGRIEKDGGGVGKRACACVLVCVSVSAYVRARARTRLCVCVCVCV